MASAEKINVAAGEEVYDVIVVGAGISGLTAAYRLLKVNPECKVLVLEAKDRVGGRTYSAEMQGVNGKDYWDLGGQWVGKTQYHILWLLEELGIDTYKQFVDGTKLMQIGGTKITSYTGFMPKLSVFELLDVEHMLRKIESDTRKVPEEDPRKAANAEELDQITLETYIKRNTWTYATYDIIQMAFAMISGLRLREISCLHALHYAATAGDFQCLLEPENGGAQEYKIHGAAQSISHKLVEQIGEEKIMLGEPVLAIDQTDKDVITVSTTTGKSFQCKYMIVAAPVQHSTRIVYTPTMPTVRMALAERMTVGHLTKFIVTYKRAFWKDKGFSGEIVSNGGKQVIPECDTGPIQMVLDSTTPNGNPALVGFYANAWQWTLVDVEKRKAAVLQGLTEFFGPEAADVIDFQDKDWSQEPYNGGCPTSVTTSGALTYYYDGFRTPLDRVHWAGTESATQWNGYFSGAVQTGLRAANEVMDRHCPEIEYDDILLEINAKLIRNRSEGNLGKMIFVSAAICLALAGLAAGKYLKLL